VQANQQHQLKHGDCFDSRFFIRAHDRPTPERWVRRGRANARHNPRNSRGIPPSAPAGSFGKMLDLLCQIIGELVWADGVGRGEKSTRQIRPAEGPHPGEKEAQMGRTVESQLQARCNGPALFMKEEYHRCRQAEGPDTRPSTGLASIRQDANRSNLFPPVPVRGLLLTHGTTRRLGRHLNHSGFIHDGKRRIRKNKKKKKQTKRHIVIRPGGAVG